MQCGTPLMIAKQKMSGAKVQRKWEAKKKGEHVSSQREDQEIKV